tara:strand:- start:3404 stop:4483 length:1080 start_codon:yes stop_codon:yes gene_type:complete
MSVNIDHQKNSLVPSTTTLDIDTTGSLVLPKGTTAQRYPAAKEGAFRVNTETSGAFYPEIFLNSGWTQVINASGTPSTGMFIKHDGTKWEATAITTDDVPEGSTNKYFTTSIADTWFSTKDTDELTEGTTNLYFTTARARVSVSGTGDISYDNSTGVISFNNTSGYVTKTDGDTWYHPMGGTSSIDFAVKDLTVHGTSTVINSTVLTIADPVFAIGQNTVTQSKDRGIEFKYNDGTAKIGFFGQDFDTGLFSFFTDATNTSENYSGTIGGFDLGGTSINKLSDVKNATPTNNDFFKYDSSGTAGWAPTTISLDDMTDVSAGSPTVDQVLKYNGTAWAPGTDTEGVTEGDAIAFAIALGG